MRVAVLVHNDVVKDARVRKEVRALVRAGHEVDVFGLARSLAGTDYPSSIEGSKSFRVIDYAELQRSGLVMRLLSNVRRHAVSALMLTAAMLFVGFFLFANATILFHAVAAGIVASMLAVNELTMRLRKARRFRFRHAVLVQSAIAILIGLALRALAGFELIHAVAFAGLLILTALIWYTSLDISRIVGYVRSFSGRWLAASQSKAREIWMRNLAMLLETHVARADYDAIHSHDVIALIAGAALKRKRPGLKLFWDAHEIYEDLAQGNASLGRLMRDLITENQPLVDGFITVSESFAEFYGASYELPKARVVMNATVYRGPVRDSGLLRTATGLGADRKILLFQGGLARKRGIGRLAEAARRLPEPWSIVAMGWGELEGYLKEVAQELSDGRARETAPLVVIPPAPHDELVNWTSGATLGIIPYEDSGRNHLYCTPNKLWEFPNAGVPILATDLVEMGKMIRAWDIGFLLPRSFTAEHIVDFLARVEDSEIENKRRNCARYSLEMAWSRFEPELLDLYNEQTHPTIMRPNFVQPGVSRHTPQAHLQEALRSGARGTLMSR